MDKQEARDRGASMRRKVLGDVQVDVAMANTAEMTSEFRDLMTRYAWGEVWCRPGLDLRTRSAIVVAALTARGYEDELAMHLRGARRNGLTWDEITEIFIHMGVYCGATAAQRAFAVAQRVRSEDEG